jgi:hypothetical protein
MIYRESYSRLSSEFLQKHRDVISHDVFHHVLAYLLFSADCRCKDGCRCEDFHQKAILSMGMAFYHKAQKEQASSLQLDVIKLILNLPDSTYLAEHYEECYPLWLINEELKARIKDNSFKMVDNLGWTMLEMSMAYYKRFRERRASLTEALRLTLGENPLKSGDKRKKYLAGDKTLSKTFNQYKPVCHFILAFEYMRRGERFIDEEDWSHENANFSIDTTDQIERFLSLSLWFRRELRELIRPNVKDPALFPESKLVSLPDWVTCDGIEIIVKPHAQKLREIERNWIVGDTSEYWRNWEAMQLKEKQSSAG